MHIHVGSNIPGYLPESDVACFSDLDSAVEHLRHEIKDQKEHYYVQCDTVSELYGDSDPEAFECGWCDVATDAEAALSAIADGDAAYKLRQTDGSVGFWFSPPVGSDIVHWAQHGPGNRLDCELNEDED